MTTTLPIAPAAQQSSAHGPAFDIAVARDGYAWWYLDAISDDHAHGLTVIAFIGSVFSPYYARARRRGTGVDPLDHCAINVALYRRGGGGRWSMTERGRGQVERDATTLRIGPSGLRWVGNMLRIDIDERGMPWPSRLRGCIELQAPRRFGHGVELAPRHRWGPVAPAARVEVDLAGARWAGAAYLDSNQGDEPLERAFRRWDWSRAHLADGASAVLYDVEPLAGAPVRIGLRFGTDGTVRPIEEAPERIALPPTLWRVPRFAHSDAGHPARVLETFTDAPFYARSMIEARWCGEPVVAMHESLSLARFDTRWVQAMLPFRMPRIGRLGSRGLR